jgi:hypothetical protein
LMGCSPQVEMQGTRTARLTRSNSKQNGHPCGWPFLSCSARDKLRVEAGLRRRRCCLDD